MPELVNSPLEVLTHPLGSSVAATQILAPPRVGEADEVVGLWPAHGRAGDLLSGAARLPGELAGEAGEAACERPLPGQRPPGLLLSGVAAAVGADQRRSGRVLRYQTRAPVDAGRFGRHPRGLMGVAGRAGQPHRRDGPALGRRWCPLMAAQEPARPCAARHHGDDGGRDHERHVPAGAAPGRGRSFQGAEQIRRARRLVIMPGHHPADVVLEPAHVRSSSALAAATSGRMAASPRLRGYALITARRR